MYKLSRINGFFGVNFFQGSSSSSPPPPFHATMNLRLRRGVFPWAMAANALDVYYSHVHHVTYAHTQDLTEIYLADTGCLSVGTLGSD